MKCQVEHLDGKPQVGNNQQARANGRSPRNVLGTVRPTGFDAVDDVRPARARRRRRRCVANATVRRSRCIDSRTPLIASARHSGGTPLMSADRRIPSNAAHWLARRWSGQISRSVRRRYRPLRRNVAIAAFGADRGVGASQFQRSGVGHSKGERSPLVGGLGRNTGVSPHRVGARKPVSIGYPASSARPARRWRG